MDKPQKIVAVIGAYADYARYDPDNLDIGSSLPPDHTPSPFPRWVHKFVDEKRAKEAADATAKG